MAAAVLTDLAAVRAQLPATSAITHLNTAMCAPLPAVTANAMIHGIGVERDTGRVSMAGYDLAVQRLAYLRGQLAALIGAAPADIAVTPSTSAGLDIVISGHDWRPGDRIVTTTLEHPAALASLRRAHHRYGVEIMFTDIGNGEPGRTLDAVTAAVGHPGTKLLMVSHVTYGTGALLPLDEIVRVAHDAGVEVLVDGAQSVGAVPVDVRASRADYLAFPGRKWLFGPDGTGGLYVHPARLGDLHPREPHPATLDANGHRNGDHDVAAGPMQKLSDTAGPMRLSDTAGPMRLSDTAGPMQKLSDGAARFDQCSSFQPLVTGLSASLDWLGSLGWPAVHATVAARTGYALARAAELPGARVLTPAGASAGIVAFTIGGVDPVACVEFLAQNAVAVRSIPGTRAIRVSCGFFTTVDDIDRAFSLVDTFRRRS